MFYVHPYLGKIPILTNMFQMGWNHQPVPDIVAKYFSGEGPRLSNINMSFPCEFGYSGRFPGDQLPQKDVW